MPCKSWGLRDWGTRFRSCWTTRRALTTRRWQRPTRRRGVAARRNVLVGLRTTVRRIALTLDLKTDADPFILSPIPPSPDGALELSVNCRTTRGRGGPRTTHPIVIEADWTVTTPHDLALERVAAAMGGYLSCLELVDRGIAGLREIVQRRARRSVARMSRDTGGRWTPAVLPADCSCESFGFGSAPEAAVHLRGTKHVAHEFGVSPRALDRLLAPILD